MYRFYVVSPFVFPQNRMQSLLKLNQLLHQGTKQFGKCSMVLLRVIVTYLVSYYQGSHEISFLFAHVLLQNKVESDDSHPPFTTFISTSLKASSERARVIRDCDKDIWTLSRLVVRVKYRALTFNRSIHAGMHTHMSTFILRPQDLLTDSNISTSA